MENPEELKQLKMAEDAQRMLRLSILVSIGVGIIGIFGHNFYHRGSDRIWIILLVASAVLASSFFIGVLFGIPKRNASTTDNYLLNNSLVEISEWLTKIIVGLGLVNLKKIPGYLDSMATYIQNSMGKYDPYSKVFSICSIIYFCMIGLYHGYNHMRLVLSLKYKYVDDELSKIKMQKKIIQQGKEIDEKDKKIDETKKETKMLKDEKALLETKADQIVNLLNETESRNNPVPDLMKIMNYTTDVSHATMMGIAETKYRTGLIKNGATDDPQKRMWGGQNEVNGRKLDAKITKIFEGLYTVDISIDSTDPGRPLQDGESAIIALHNTFIPPVQLKTVVNGSLRVSMRTTGSFTIGALLDEGRTELELDLAELPGVDDYFKNH